MSAWTLIATSVYQGNLIADGGSAPEEAEKLWRKAGCRTAGSGGHNRRSGERIFFRSFASMRLFLLMQKADFESFAAMTYMHMTPNSVIQLREILP